MLNIIKMATSILISGYLCWGISECIDYMQGKKTTNDIYNELKGIREDLQMIRYTIYSHGNE